MLPLNRSDDIGEKSTVIRSSNHRHQLHRGGGKMPWYPLHNWGKRIILPWQ